MLWPADPSLPSDLLFSGLKAIDAGSWVAGPAAATILADFGADVIKIEQPGPGDGYRALHTGPRSPQSDIDYMWLADNRNKRGIVLNLATPEANAILHELVRECDVYLTNQPIGPRRRFGLMYEDLAPLNPRIIYASLTAFGEVGDEAENDGFDANAYWARSGLVRPRTGRPPDGDRDLRLDRHRAPLPLPHRSRHARAHLTPRERRLGQPLPRTGCPRRRRLHPPTCALRGGADAPPL
ncbi:MAG: hypothetical protein EXR66_01800 [Dehalococcoidia bacterium]|nr:hypothetical protein [Dehalococcoidia bacterium]